MPTINVSITKKYIFEYSHEDIVQLIIKDIYENDKSINVSNADIDFETHGYGGSEVKATIKN